jgi:hypothetical protein
MSSVGRFTDTCQYATSPFTLAAAVFGLRSWPNPQGRYELVISVPLSQVPEIVRLIDRISEEAEKLAMVRGAGQRSSGERGGGDPRLVADGGR